MAGDAHVARLAWAPRPLNPANGAVERPLIGSGEHRYLKADAGNSQDGKRRRGLLEERLCVRLNALLGPSPLVDRLGVDGWERDRGTDRRGLWCLEGKAEPAQVALFEGRAHQPGQPPDADEEESNGPG